LVLVLLLKRFIVGGVCRHHQISVAEPELPDQNKLGLNMS